MSVSLNEKLKVEFLNSIDKNYNSISVYFETKHSHFIELTSLINEILKCLILELNQASIFSTNHLLERLVKLVLIKKHTLGINYSQPDLYNQKTEEAIKKYDGEILFNTLLFAKKEKLITDEESQTLNNLRDKVRNPYSHAGTKKIIADAPAKFVGFMFNINDIKEQLMQGKAITGGTKTEITTLSPTFSQLYQESFSKDLALDYFRTVFEVLVKLDERLDSMSQ
ncbi:hypothetical protein ASE92_17260 [Pedobacter sp. Leaf41]|uniref:hypothetical protein n=1 Tax=Pedobacter sp. Leaf41 TaxID=1736218 RepID=UPI0007032497|nr:hypothetical protein [Pedobacter sp. Leaf41]KQN32355.1 hypothetical protein ASE92_17260 [Pedobacter sp. Leaf41]